MDRLRLVGILCGLLLLSFSSAGHAATSLPGGVHQLQEGFQDWQMLCHDGTVKDSQGGAVRCVLTQQTLDAGSRRRMLSVRLEPDGAQMRGVAVVPFGLDLTHGLTLTNSVQPVGDMYSFSTCLPVGCLAPLSFDDQQWGNLLRDRTATLTAQSLSGQPMKLLFSTRGLAEALRRARSLMQ